MRSLLLAEATLAKHQLVSKYRASRDGLFPEKWYLQDGSRHGQRLREPIMLVLVEDKEILKDRGRAMGQSDRWGNTMRDT